MKNVKSGEKLAKHYDALAEEYEARYHYGLRAEIRNQIIFSTLKKLITKKPSRILDAGGGTGFYSIPLAVKGHEIIILDVSEKMLKKARENAEKSNVTERVRTILGDIDHLNFPNSYFDVILCHLAFGHVSNASRTLREFYRVLKNDGILSLTVSNKHFYSIRESLRGNFLKAERILRTKNFFVSPRKSIPEIRTFTKDEIVSLCKDANLKIVSVKGMRIVSDYLPIAQRKSKVLERLETEMSKIEDLSSIGKHIYVVCRKGKT